MHTPADSGPRRTRAAAAFLVIALALATAIALAAPAVHADTGLAPGGPTAPAGTHTPGTRQSPTGADNAANSPSANLPADAAATPSLLPGIPLTGRVFGDIYFPAKDFDTATYRQTSASLWLQGDPKLGEHGSARFILTGDALQNNTVSVVDSVGNSTSAREFRVRLREGYVTFAKNGWELRAGQQIIPWGKSDAINPTDFLTAKDYTFFNPDEEVRRLGAVSLWASWTPNQGNSPLTFTVVGTPVFAQSRLLVPPSAVPAGITLSGSPTVPAQTIGHTETAYKVAYAGNHWDASLLAFRGFNHLPEFTITGVKLDPATALPTAFTVGQTFHGLSAAGGDFSFTSGKWIFRGESAYVWTENNEGLNPLIQPSHWDTVLGIERPLGDDFRVQAQFIYRLIPNFTDLSTFTAADPVTTQVQQGVARGNALLLAYQDKSRPGASFRFAYSNESNGWDAELFLLGNFVGGDYLIRPKVGYHWTDTLLTTVGLEWYGGPDDRPLGSLKVYNSLFTEAKYTF